MDSFERLVLLEEREEALRQHWRYVRDRSREHAGQPAFIAPTAKQVEKEAARKWREVRGLPEPERKPTPFWAAA